MFEIRAGSSPQHNLPALTELTGQSDSGCRPGKPSPGVSPVLGWHGLGSAKLGSSRESGLGAEAGQVLTPRTHVAPPAPARTPSPCRGKDRAAGGPPRGSSAAGPPGTRDPEPTDGMNQGLRFPVG